MSIGDKTKREPSMDDFKTDNWEKSTPKERLNSLQYLENKMAEEAGRSPRKIKIDENLAPGECGYYSDNFFKRNNIYINEDYLYSNEPSKQYEAMDTVIHEGRHAYQNDCAKERIENTENAETLSSWKKNTEEYNPFGYDNTTYSYYRFQPIEDDANNYAKTKMESYSDCYSSDFNYRNHIGNTNIKQEEDEFTAERRLGNEYKQNIASDIYDRYDYRHKIGNYAESKNIVRGQKTIEGQDNVNNNNSITRGEKPKETIEPAAKSNVEQNRRCELPKATDAEPSKSTAASSSDSTAKASTNSGSTKAAEDASKAASEQAAKNNVAKSTGMGV